MLELLFATIVGPLEVFPCGCVLFMILEPENNNSKVLFLVMVNLRTDKILQSNILENWIIKITFTFTEIFMEEKSKRKNFSSFY